MADDASPRRSPGTPASKGNGRGCGCSPGCLLSGLVAVALSLIFGTGTSSPNTYWHHPGGVQAFEGPDRVVLFVEVERVTKLPGLLRESPYRHNAVEFVRIDILPDGIIERTHLQSNLEDNISFELSRYAAVYLANGFYLVDDPWTAPRPAYRLGPDRIERLSPNEAIRAAGEDVLPASDPSSDLSGLDAISAKRGWSPLHRKSDDWQYPDPLGLINSTRHGVRLWQVGRSWDKGTPQSIIAESLSPTNRWTHTLLELDTRPWKSYKDEDDRDYLREQYAANPAR